MILVDTSAWISFLKKTDPQIVDIIKMQVKWSEIYAVSAVFGELIQGIKNKLERDIIIILWENLPKVDEEDLFIRAEHISNNYKLFSIGVGLCYILAACADNNMALWTLDKKLQNSFDELAL